MESWPFGAAGRNRFSLHATSDPVLASAQAARLEALLTAYEGRPEESWMILSRIELSYLQAGDPAAARAAHDRAVVMAGRSGHAARERWERSPRWFQLIAHRFRDSVELHWTTGRYRRAGHIIDTHLTGLGRRVVSQRQPA